MVMSAPIAKLCGVGTFLPGQKDKDRVRVTPSAVGEDEGSITCVSGRHDDLVSSTRIFDFRSHFF